MYTAQLQIVCNSWTVAARELLHGACERTMHKTQQLRLARSHQQMLLRQSDVLASEGSK